MGKIIVFSTPLFLLLMALEWWWSRRESQQKSGKMGYLLSDSISSLNLGVFSQFNAPFLALFSIGIYTFAFESVAIFPHLPLWETWYGFVLALVIYDLGYYWQHRAGHEVAVFWAAHVVHHQSQHYNLSTALRQSSSTVFLSWIFYLPLAILGVSPKLFAILVAVDLLYQFWVHTEYVGKLGWFDRIFCSPSNHRVHHAINDQYLDRNYGGILMVWDHCFGTFQEETHPCVYGTRSPLQSCNPFWSNAEVYWSLLKASLQTRRWTDKLRLWLKPPGWQPSDLLRFHPKPPFVLDAVVHYNPPVAPKRRWLACVLFFLSVSITGNFLWFEAKMPLAEALVWWFSLAILLWIQGLFLQSRLSLVDAGLLGAATIAGLVSVATVSWAL
jgi:alkylglycerol monooxygenase